MVVNVSAVSISIEILGIGLPFDHPEKKFLALFELNNGSTWFT